MQFYTLTDTGLRRTNNEDSCQAKIINGFTVLVLADGMGGANSGEIASSKAIEAVFEVLEKALSKSLSLPEIPRILSKAIDKANTDVHKLSLKDSKNSGMGTTLDICVQAESVVYIAHIGDSRVYKVAKDGSIIKLTKDHSLVEYMLDSGALTPEEAEHHPQKNIITRALGTTVRIEADIFSRTLDDGDRLLLCSDGLTNMLTDDLIASVTSKGLSLSQCAQELVKLANEAGGTDNITVIIAQK